MMNNNYQQPQQQPPTNFLSGIVLTMKYQANGKRPSVATDQYGNQYKWWPNAGIFIVEGQLYDIGYMDQTDQYGPWRKLVSAAPSANAGQMPQVPQQPAQPYQQPAPQTPQAQQFQPQAQPQPTFAPTTAQAPAPQFAQDQGLQATLNEIKSLLAVFLAYYMNTTSERYDPFTDPQGLHPNAKEQAIAILRGLNE